MSEQLLIFVYGTLKRGHERARLWPGEPLRITPATTRGALYDLGPYPALVDGEDLVAGELWVYSVDQMDEILSVLDRVEGIDLGDVRSYIRREIPVLSVENELRTAYAYLYADPAGLSKEIRVQPNERGWCEWTRLLAQ